MPVNDKVTLGRYAKIIPETLTLVKVDTGQPDLSSFLLSTKSPLY